MRAEFGAYGKIPGLGDFLRIGLGPGFTRGWDAWLQSAMTTCQHHLGARWNACYMSAPIWRFTLPAGVAGDAAMIGVMMPSVDRVGRRFPLTLAAPLPAGVATVALHLSADATFAALEDVALDALEDGVTADTLTRRLASVPGPDTIRLAAGKTDLLRLCAADMAGLAPALAGAATTRALGPVCLWTCIFDEGCRLMITRDLPAEGEITGLFDPEDEQWMAANLAGDTG